MRTIQLESIGNVRDLGSIPVKGKRIVTPGLIYRGSALTGLSENDRNVLFGDRGITCVIDVRTGWERAEKPDPAIPGVENLHIPFYDLDIVGIEYTESAAGTKVVGRDVACEPVRFYASLSNPLTAGQMGKAVRKVFDCALAGKPVYAHCSGGKDRAGILSLLVLMVLGASADDILDDYLATNVARDKDHAKMMERFLRFADGDEERARELVEEHRAVPQNVQSFYASVCERYGSMDAFVHDVLGLSDQRIIEIRKGCTQPR